MDIEPYIYSLAAGFAVFCVTWLLVVSFQTAREQAARFAGPQPQAESALFKLLLPPARWLGFVIGGLAAKIEMRFGRDASHSLLRSTRLRIERKLLSAGHPENLMPDDFLGLICIGGAVGALVGFGIYLRIGVPMIIIVSACVGAYVPVRWLNSRMAARQKSISKMLPYAIDLLTLSVEAGLDFTEALARIVTKLGRAPLALELGQMLREIQLGKPRAQALRDLGHRVDVPELNTVVAALIQADQLGASLAPILRIQSDQLRTRRSQTAEKLAMEAPVKILFPLIVFIFPTIFIMIFGPIVLKVLFKR